MKKDWKFFFFWAKFFLKQKYQVVVKKSSLSKRIWKKQKKDELNLNFFFAKILTLTCSFSFRRGTGCCRKSLSHSLCFLAPRSFLHRSVLPSRWSEATKHLRKFCHFCNDLFLVHWIEQSIWGHSDLHIHKLHLNDQATHNFLDLEHHSFQKMMSKRWWSSKLTSSLQKTWWKTFLILFSQIKLTGFLKLFVKKYLEMSQQKLTLWHSCQLAVLQTVTRENSRVLRKMTLSENGILTYLWRFFDLISKDNQSASQN